MYLHFIYLWKYRNGKENNILPGLSIVLLSTLGRPQLLTIPFSCLWVIACLPTDPSSLICSLASVFSFLGTPYKDSALPDLSASAEQSRNFERLPRIAFRCQRLSPAQSSDFPGVCGNTQNPLCSRRHKGNETSRKVTKQAEKELVSTENKIGPFCVIQVLSQTSCTSTIGYRRLGLSHTIHSLGW